MITGIHHVTGITGDGQRNIDFYTGLLGLRLVKLTVNFDDPGSYHLYYGDELGRPGSILTFFVWPGAARGRIGPPQVTTIAFSVPKDSVPYWMDRFQQHNIQFMNPITRIGDKVMRFSDPEGLQLELIASPARDPRMPWTGADIPFDSAIRGIHSVTLSVEVSEHTAGLLTSTLGFRPEQQEGNRYRFSVGPGGAGAFIDVLCMPDARHGSLGAGTIHHLAWRTPDDERQEKWLRTLASAGYNSSPIMDRMYFKSIYFREPGGVLFEIATDTPGFMADEPIDRLGAGLKLPKWLEPARRQLEAVLPPLQLPQQDQTEPQASPPESDQPDGQQGGR